MTDRRTARRSLVAFFYLAATRNQAQPPAAGSNAALKLKRSHKTPPKAQRPQTDRKSPASPYMGPRAGSANVAFGCPLAHSRESRRTRACFGLFQATKIGPKAWWSAIWAAATAIGRCRCRVMWAKTGRVLAVDIQRENAEKASRSGS